VDYLIVVHVNDRLHQLQHEALNLAQTKECAVFLRHEEVYQSRDVHFAALEGKENVLLFVAYNDLLELDDVGVWVLHLTELAQDGDLTQGRDREAIALLRHFNLLQRVLFARDFVFSEEDHTISACADLGHFSEVCHAA